MNTTEQNIPSDIGAIPADLATKLTEADPMENAPTFVPGKPGFEVNDTLAGTYVRTKRVYSDKLMGGKRDDAGRKFRELHMFRDHKGRSFGIWGVGQLDYALSRVEPGTFLAVQYRGQIGKPIRAGQSVPHAFEFKGVNLNFDWNAADEAATLTDAPLS
jgi:hypothetical protein